MEARLKAELDRFQALEKQLKEEERMRKKEERMRKEEERMRKDEERIRKEEERMRKEEGRMRKEEERMRKDDKDHSLPLGLRGGPSYSLDDPNIAALLSASISSKLTAAGITDICTLDEQAILSLNLSNKELDELLRAIYLAKYLKASPELCRALKEMGQDPLSLWKLEYLDVQNMDISEALKKELFGLVLEQRNSFVANVETPTSKKIILKGWKDENLAFLQKHEYKPVTRDFESKKELTKYIDKLRAGF